jgi:hypothetical protein
MIEIYVRDKDGKPKSVTVDENTTVLDVLTTMVNDLKFEFKAADALAQSLKHKKTLLQDGERILNHCQHGDILELHQRREHKKAQVETKKDEDVIELLNVRLNVHTTRPGRKQFVLISIASFVPHGKSYEEIMRQQCPRDVVAHCEKHGMQLRVILADSLFTKGQGTQIYEADPNWKLMAETLGGKIRHYVYEGTTDSITAYATDVEWESHDEQKTVAGVNLQHLGYALEELGGHLLVRSWNGDVLYHSNGCPPLGKG